MPLTKTDLIAAVAAQLPIPSVNVEIHGDDVVFRVLYPPKRLTQVGLAAFALVVRRI